MVTTVSSGCLEMARFGCKAESGASQLVIENPHRMLISTPMAWLVNL